MLRSFFSYAPGVEINYEVHGTGEKTLICLHGLGASIESWRDLVPLLEDDYEIVLADLKGHGLSSKPADGAYRVHEHAAIISAFVEHLDRPSPVLIGNSLGGAVASLAALCLQRAGKPVKGLILIAAVGFPQPVPRILGLMNKPIIGHLGRFLVPARLAVWLVLRDAFWDRSRLSRERVDRHARYHNLPGTRRGILCTLKQLLRERPDSLAPEIAQLIVPTLIVWGEYDRVIPVENAYLFKQAVAGSRLWILPDCGHIPQEELPSETARVIRGFV